MARSALSDEEIGKFRARAILVATRLFAHEGYGAVSLRRIAEELGVSPMTPYRYFEDKDEIFAMVRADAFRRFADEQAAAFDSSEQAAIRLGALGRNYVEFALREPDSYRIMFELKQELDRSYPALAHEEQRAFSYLLRAVEAAITARIIEGEPLLVAHRLWAQVHGLVTLHLAGKLKQGVTVQQLLDATIAPPVHAQRERGERPWNEPKQKSAAKPKTQRKPRKVRRA